MKPIPLVLLALWVTLPPGPSSAVDKGTDFASSRPGKLFLYSIHWSPGSATETHPVEQLIRLLEESPSETLTIDIPGLAEGALPMKLVLIPAGTFQMGSTDTERGRFEDREGPVHTVTLTNDFYFGETEVTQAQWQALMGENPSTRYPEPFSDYGIGNDYPVYYVDWNEITQANGFLAQLDAKTGYSGFRLPSEAEWEYACRAGTTTRFYFGDSLECEDVFQDCAAGVLPGNRSDYMWYWFNSYTPTHGTKPVRGKLPNAFGLYDMYGNVWEWCQDCWLANFYSLPGATEPNPLCNSSSGDRAFRGGGWADPAGSCRSSMRTGAQPGIRSGYGGVRVVLPASP